MRNPGKIFAGCIAVTMSFSGRLWAVGQDVFKDDPACSIIDAQPARAFSLDGAVRALGTCAQALTDRYAVQVSVEAGAVGIDGGRDEAPGILFRVPGEIRKDCHILMDLSYSIRERRKGILLGLPAGVWSGSLEGPEVMSAEGVPGIPAWIDAASLKADAKRTRARMGGGLHVVLFDKDDNEVELTVPAAVGAQAAATFVKATDEELGPYTLASLEAAAPGVMGKMLASAVIPPEMDAFTRKALQDLSAGLRTKDGRQP